MCWIFVIKLQIKADTSHSVTVTVIFWSEVICYGILAFWNNMLPTLPGTVPGSAAIYNGSATTASAHSQPASISAEGAGRRRRGGT